MFNFNLKIMGSSFTEHAQEVFSILEKGDEIIPVPEPENKFDPNAIALYFGEQKLGYVAKETAPKIIEDVKENRIKITVAQVTGGTEGKENYGCNLDVEIEREDDKSNTII